MVQNRPIPFFLIASLVVAGFVSLLVHRPSNDAQAKAKVEFSSPECGENECCGSPASAPPTEPQCPSPPPGYRLRNPGIPSGALCRGACGVDCNPNACAAVPNFVLCVGNATSHRNCHYPVTECGSHPACRTHDQCYDNCVAFLPPAEVANCQRGCDLQCLDEWPDLDCAAWALGNGPQPDRLRYTSPPVVGGLFPGPCP